MNRRNAIRTAIIFSAGAAFLPACLHKDNATITLKNITVTVEQQNMLAQLTETIIPKTNFIGASDLKAHQFVLMMVDDCYPPDKQKLFMEGLQKFDKMVAEKYSKPFADCTVAQKNEWLTQLESKNAIPAEAINFYQTSKQLTLQAFTSSKQYMQGVRNYNMVPGPIYKGCISIKNKTA